MILLTNIRLTEEMETIFIKGGSNITIVKNEREYFFRMFDATMNVKDIKQRCSWQAVKKLDDKENLEAEVNIVKGYI